jgi:F0F1-type ATP synthase membrane subunit b/b'
MAFLPVETLERYERRRSPHASHARLRRHRCASRPRASHLALEKIALAESKAIAEVRNTAVDVAIAAVRQIASQTLDPGRKSKLIDAAIADLPQRLN